MDFYNNGVYFLRSFIDLSSALMVFKQEKVLL